MGRVNRRRRDDDAPLDPLRATGGVREEVRAGRAYAVRNVSGTSASRAYRCPGCQQEVTTGTPHVVVWPTDGVLGVESRRHWHTTCWTRA